LLADVYASCGQKPEAEALFEDVSKSTEISDLFWAWSAAKHHQGYDAATWTSRLKAGIEHAEKASRGGSSPAWWRYTAGTLRVAAGEKAEGESELREVFLFPDSRMCHHLARLALANATLP